jgi:glucose/arabinose dehydrogenase
MRPGTAGGICAALALGLFVIIALAGTGDSLAGQSIQGDADCSGEIDTHDSLASLRLSAGADPAADCAAQAGDVDCDGDVDSDDVLALLRHVGGIVSAGAAGPACTLIGELLPEATAATASATQTAAGSPTLTSTPATDATSTPSPTPSPTPPAEPQSGGYHIETVISRAALGDLGDRLMDVVPWPGDENKAILVLQDGRVYRISLAGPLSSELWGDLSDTVFFDGQEQGLLSLAFPPAFSEDPEVYAYYSQGAPNNAIVARLDVTDGLLDEGSLELVIEIEDFHIHHNGGRLVFDKDGYLMLSMGDGGAANDSQDTGQDLSRLLGKVIRIDVSTQPYSIPTRNPFAGQAGAGTCNGAPQPAPAFCEEIFAWGFRNPWRMSMDRLTGDIWLGDVGQNQWEEVDHVINGGNYGWDCREGPIPHTTSADCANKTFMEPYAVYDHTFGVAIVGGYVYRGTAFPELAGWYIYADYVSGNVWAVDTESEGDPVLLTDDAPTVSSFAELPSGELLIVGLISGIRRLARD